MSNIYFMGLLLKNILAAVFLLALSQSLLLHWLGSKRRLQRPKSRFFHMEMAFFDGNKLLHRLAKHGCLVLATAAASLVKVPKKVFFSFVHYQYLLQQSSKSTLRMHRFFRHTLVVLDRSKTIKINLELNDGTLIHGIWNVWVWRIYVHTLTSKQNSPSIWALNCSSSIF